MWVEIGFDGITNRMLCALYISRVRPLDPQPGQMCDYRWRVVQRPGNHVVKRGNLSHPYGSALSLLAAVAAAADEGKRL